MKILLTGASGFIGAWVASKLLQTPGVETVLVLRPTSDRWRLRMLGCDPGRANIAYGDLTCTAEVHRMLGDVRPEVVIHLATIYRAPGAATHAQLEQVTYRATMELFEAFVAVGGRRFIAAGTCFEYGHQPPGKIPETAPARPSYDYASAKARATADLIAAGRAQQRETLVLRIFSPCGSLEDDKRIVPQLIAAGLTGRKLALTQGRQVRDFVFVEDVAEAFVNAALCPSPPQAQAVYNVCSGIGHSLREVADCVGRVVGRPLDLDWGALPYRPDEMMCLVGDNRKIRDELGWAPRFNLDEGLRRMVDDLRGQLRVA